MMHLVFLSVFCCVLSAGDTEVVPFFRDMSFQRGFLLSHPSPKKGRAVEKVLRGGKEGAKPRWRLCQWATRHSLAAAPRLVKPDGAIVFENEGKRVVIGGASSAERDLVLELKAQNEYRRPRLFGEPWPHLLVEQDAGTRITLDKLQKVQLHLALQLLFCRDHMAGRADPGLHAAQFQLFLIVKNINRQSGDYQDYFWFGVPFFDNRHDLPRAHRAKDAGKDSATGKFIYTIAGSALMSTSLRDGKWKTIEKDLLPFILSGLECACERGYLKSRNPRDYAVVNMNLGWEMPGTYHAAVKLRDFSLGAIRRSFR